MLKRKLWRVIGAVGIGLFILSSNVCAQTERWLYPLRGTPLLSGNFGELRATHLHSGVDFKTGGREGVPVICVKDGKVARVKVSPTGYGNALYIEHGGGITTVYGHLSRFTPPVEKVVREMQYKKESFAIDENLIDRSIFFRAGDTIAYSGNSGSSMGPHLHFEVRETQSGEVLNPLPFFPVADETAPGVRGLYVYTFSAEGVANGSRRIEVKSAGKQVYRGGKIAVPAGRVGIGVQADDYMKGSWNKLGVYKMEMNVRGERVFEMKMDCISFDHSLLSSAIKDFHHYREGRQVYLTFGDHQHQLPGIHNRAGGFIEVQKDSVVDVVIKLWDINGNRSLVSFRLEGGEATPALVLPGGARVLAGKQRCVVREKAYGLDLKEGALALPVVCLPCVCYREKDSTGVMEVFSLTERTYPLLKSANLFAEGNFSDKSVLCSVDEQGGLTPLSTTWSIGGLSAPTRVLGEYVIQQDTIAPEIVYAGVSGRKVRFRISDNLSGVSSYRVEVNGKWCLFRYDAKNRLLEGSLNEPLFTRGKNQIVVKVEDGVKNSTIFETNVYKK